MPDYTVTKKAMRPASDKEQCFYCQQVVGATHKDDCVLIKKKVMVSLVIEYPIVVPAHWKAEDVLFFRNEGSWCSDNLISELDELRGSECLCDKADYTYIGETGAVSSEPYLEED